MELIRCGQEMKPAEIHRVRPWKHGGLTTIANMRLMCCDGHRASARREQSRHRKGERCMGAICVDCNQEMRRGVGCTLAKLELRDGETVARDVYDESRPCHDCGVERGQLHHLGCDWEKCPRCGWQLITCGCWSDGDDDDEEDEWG
jgi:hypothetical protein